MKVKLFKLVKKLGNLVQREFLQEIIFKNQKTVNGSIVFGDEAASTEMGIKI
jgi:hypothetical protein